VRADDLGELLGLGAGVDRLARLEIDRIRTALAK
jgi:hypothetical protein